MRGVARLVIICGFALLAMMGSTVAASADEPIQPNQYFLGLVNGSNANAVVYTVCPGPIFPGRTGPVAGGQTLAVAHVNTAIGPYSPVGYTGPYSQVYAWFAQDSSPNGPQPVKFTAYRAPQTVPPSVRVPCGGTGQVEFSSCPDLAPPCASGSIPDFVNVRFVDIAY